MAANTAPIWTRTPVITPVTITQSSANVNSTAPGTIGTNCFLACSSAADGSFLQKVRFTFVSTTHAINSVGTTLQIYISTINTGATSAANTWLLAEAQAAAQTITTTTSPYVIEVPINMGVQASRYILVAQSIAQNANANWNAIAICGEY